MGNPVQIAKKLNKSCLKTVTQNRAPINVLKIFATFIYLIILYLFKPIQLLNTGYRP